MFEIVISQYVYLARIQSESGFESLEATEISFESLEFLDLVQRLVNNAHESGMRHYYVGRQIGMICSMKH